MMTHINVPAPEGSYDSLYKTCFTPEELLEEIGKLRLSDPQAAQRSAKAYDFRFYTQKDGREPVVCDRFLGFWVDTQGFERTSGDSRWALRMARKDLGAFLDNKKIAAHFSVHWPDTRILYEQLYNSARRYLEACRTDRSYGTLLFGLMPMKADRLPGKMLADFVDFALIFPMRCGLLSDYPVVGKAAMNAWMDAMPKTWDQVWGRVYSKISEKAAEEMHAILYDEI